MNSRCTHILIIKIYIIKYIYLAILCDLFWMVKWPFQRISDLQLGDRKVTLTHLVYNNNDLMQYSPSLVLLESVLCPETHRFDTIRLYDYGTVQIISMYHHVPICTLYSSPICHVGRELLRSKNLLLICLEAYFLLQQKRIVAAGANNWWEAI